MNYKCYRCGKDVRSYTLINGDMFCKECYCKIFTDEAVPPKQTDEELLADIKRFMAKYGFNCVEDMEEEMILRDIKLLRKENKELRKTNKQWSKLCSELNRDKLALLKEQKDNTTKADVYKRDADNMERTLEEAGEEIEALKRQLAELPKKICDEIREDADDCFDEDGDDCLVIGVEQLDFVQEIFTKGARNERD